MNDFEIRPARNYDAEAIAGVHIDARRESMPRLPVLHSREETVAYFKDVLLNDEVVVAELNHFVVGFIAMRAEYVDHLYIAPACQGHGLGDRLLNIAKKLHPDGLTLVTFQNNMRARRFYEARGFSAEEFRDGSHNQEREPDVFYRWRPREPV
jgi:ribosomal protein S18 acetylase RimI-like enzyme